MDNKMMRLLIVLIIAVPGTILTAYFMNSGAIMIGEAHEKEDDAMWREGKRHTGISQIILVLTVIGSVLIFAFTNKRSDPVVVTEQGFDVDVYGMAVDRPYYREYSGSKYRITRLDNDHVEFAEVG